MDRLEGSQEEEKVVRKTGRCWKAQVTLPTDHQRLGHLQRRPYRSRDRLHLHLLQGHEERQMPRIRPMDRHRAPPIIRWSRLRLRPVVQLHRQIEMLHRASQRSRASQHHRAIQTSQQGARQTRKQRKTSARRKLQSRQQKFRQPQPKLPLVSVVHTRTIAALPQYEKIVAHGLSSKEPSSSHSP